MFPSHISEYRRAAIEGARAEELTGYLYEGVVVALRRGATAAAAGQVEARVRETERALAIIAELNSVLDFERGGAVAKRLGSFYKIARGRVISASIASSVADLEQLAAQFQGLRDAWRVVEKNAEENAGAGAGNAANAEGQSGAAAPPARGRRPAAARAEMSAAWSA